MRRWFVVAFILATAVLPLRAQQLTVGIAPTFDAGADEDGPMIAQYLTLFLYRDLLRGPAFSPVLLNPGGVYSSFDTSWLFDYARDRTDLDVLLVTTLKPTAKDGSMVVEVTLLDAHTGSKLTTWTATSAPDNKKGWAKNLGTTLVNQSGLSRNGLGQVGLSQSGRFSSSAFEKSPLGIPTVRIADSIRDTLPAKTTGMSHGQAVSSAVPPAAPAAPCVTHTHITYGYKHAASRSQMLVVNDLDQTTTLKDGVSTFNLPEGPMLVQFSVNDAPYTMSKQPFYQLSTIHSCAKSTLVIDLGPQGDEHHHWE